MPASNESRKRAESGHEDLRRAVRETGARVKLAGYPAGETADAAARIAAAHLRAEAKLADTELANAAG